VIEVDIELVQGSFVLTAAIRIEARTAALFGPSGWPRWWAFFGALRASDFWAVLQRAFFGPDALLGMGVFTCVSSSNRTETDTSSSRWRKRRIKTSLGRGGQ